MRGFLTALLFMGCATGVPRCLEKAVDPDAICLLIDGNLNAWRGLGRLDRAQLPSCVGARIEQGTARFRLVLLATDTYRAPSSGAEVRVYSAINGGRIELIDVKPSSAPDAAALLATLGAPAATHVYSVEDRAAANLPAPRGGAIEETIYADQGLAVAVAREPSGRVVVMRVRGFKPMPAKRYLDEYVRFEPEML